MTSCVSSRSASGLSPSGLSTSGAEKPGLQAGLQELGALPFSDLPRLIGKLLGLTRDQRAAVERMLDAFGA